MPDARDTTTAPYRGLRGKYDVFKDGEPVTACFVLRYTDRHARAALLAYAESCEHDNHVLARDLRRVVALFDDGEAA